MLENNIFNEHILCYDFRKRYESAYLPDSSSQPPTWRSWMGLTPNEFTLLDLLKQVAAEGGEKGRALVTLIGELSACKILDLAWQPGTGFDAKDLKGEKCCGTQISRRDFSQ